MPVAARPRIRSRRLRGSAQTKALIKIAAPPGTPIHPGWLRCPSVDEYLCTEVLAYMDVFTACPRGPYRTGRTSGYR